MYCSREQFLSDLESVLGAARLATVVLLLLAFACKICADVPGDMREAVLLEQAQNQCWLLREIVVGGRAEQRGYAAGML